MPLGCIISADPAQRDALASVPEDRLWNEIDALWKAGVKSGSAVDLNKAYMDFQSFTLEHEPLETMFLGKDLVGMVDGGELVVHFNPPDETARLSRILSASSRTVFTEMRMAVEDEMREKIRSRQKDYPVYGPRSFLDRLLGRPGRELPIVLPEIRSQDHEWEVELFERCKALYASAAKSGSGMLTVISV